MLKRERVREKETSKKEQGLESRHSVLAKSKLLKCNNEMNTIKTKKNFNLASLSVSSHKKVKLQKSIYTSRNEGKSITWTHLQKDRAMRADNWREKKVVDTNMTEKDNEKEETIERKGYDNKQDIRKGDEKIDVKNPAIQSRLLIQSSQTRMNNLFAFGLFNINSHPLPIYEINESKDEEKEASDLIELSYIARNSYAFFEIDDEYSERKEELVEREEKAINTMICSSQSYLRKATTPLFQRLNEGKHHDPSYYEKDEPEVYQNSSFFWRSVFKLAFL